MISDLGCVGPFGGNSGEALVFASPFSLFFVIETQTRTFSLLFTVREGETDGQRRIQLGDEVPISVQKSDVKDRASKLLMVEGVVDDATKIRNN